MAFTAEHVDVLHVRFPHGTTRCPGCSGGLFYRIFRRILFWKLADIRVPDFERRLTTANRFGVDFDEALTITDWFDKVLRLVQGQSPESITALIFPEYIIRLATPEIARQERCCPIAADGERTVIAFASPPKEETLDIFRFVLNSVVVSVVLNDRDIEALIERFYGAA